LRFEINLRIIMAMQSNFKKICSPPLLKIRVIDNIILKVVTKKIIIIIIVIRIR